jgi:hypothetical protein
VIIQLQCDRRVGGGGGKCLQTGKLARVLIYYALQLLQADWLSSGAAAEQQLE